MKKFLASTALVLITSGPLMAESHTGGMFVDQNVQGDIYGSNLIGMRLYVSETEVDESMDATEETRAEWNDVGEINDILISGDGEVKAVLLDIGGFLGLGEKTIAVDMESLRFLRDGDDPDDIFVAMQGTEESLESAPEFQRTAMEGTAMEGATDDAGTAEETEMAEADTTASGDPVTAWERPAIERDGYQNIEATDLTAEDMEGAALYGADDDSIGEVEDLIVTTDGQIEQAIVDVGGFLGLGEHRIAIDFDELQVVRSDDGSDLRVYVSATKEQLEAREPYNG